MVRIKQDGSNQLRIGENMNEFYELLDYDSLSEKLKVPKGTLYWLVNKKKIPFIRLGGRTVRFCPHQIKKWIEEGEMKEAVKVKR